MRLAIRRQRHVVFLLLATAQLFFLVASALEPDDDDEPMCEVFSHAAELPQTDGVLHGHWLMIPEGCDEMLSVEAQEELQPRTVAIAAGALAEALGLFKGDCAVAACLSSGSPVDLLPAGAKMKPWTERNLTSWVDTQCQLMLVGLVSLLNETESVEMRWAAGNQPIPAGLTFANWRRNSWVDLHKGSNTSVTYYPNEYVRASQPSRTSPRGTQSCFRVSLHCPCCRKARRACSGESNTRMVGRWWC